MAITPQNLNNDPNKPKLLGIAQDPNAVDENRVVAVVEYHGLRACLTEGQLAGGGVDAAEAKAMVELKVQEENIKKNQEAERKLEQGLMNLGVDFCAGALEEMHGKMAVDGGASLPTVEQIIAGNTPATFDPAAPRPNENLLQKMSAGLGLTL
jgi:hypothetical protein